MRIALCGSMNFIELIKSTARDLRTLGHEVSAPEGGENEGLEEKIANDYIRHYFDVISQCDAILVMNFRKNDLNGYVGPNTFLEIGFAHILNKKIFLFNSLSSFSPYLDELQAMLPTVISGDLAILAEYDRELFKNKNAEFKDLSDSDIAKHKYMIDKAMENSQESIDQSRRDLTILNNRLRSLQAICVHSKTTPAPPFSGFSAECDLCGSYW